MQEHRFRAMASLALLLLIAPVVGWAGGTGLPRSVVPEAEWERKSPEALGWSPETLERALDLARELGSDALLVVVDGVVIAEHGDVARRFNVRSIRKPLLGALLGMEVESGRIGLDATLEELGIDDKAGLTDEERRATIADLLTSRSGVYHRAAWEHPSHASSRPTRGSYEPGTHFYYNNWDFNVLGSIYNRTMDGDLFEEFRDRVAFPLSMQDYRVEDGDYLHEEVSEHPAYRFRMSARDLARFGLLFLRKGHWGDQKIVPASWVQESTKTHVPDATPHSGYGYLWRTYPKYGTQYAATGAGSQMLVVAPDLGLVVAHLEAIAPGQVGVPRSRFWQLYGMIAAAAPGAE